MSLTTEQLARTRSEVRTNLSLTGLTTGQVATDLDWSPERLHAALHSTGTSDPVDIWQLRDYLERAVRDTGRTPVPYTVLTPGARVMAQLWFHLRAAPCHDFATTA